MPSLRNAINEMCRSCIYDPGNSNGKWREQVAACCSSCCPLHSVRPQTTAKSRREVYDQARSMSGHDDAKVPLKVAVKTTKTGTRG